MIRRTRTASGMFLEVELPWFEGPDPNLPDCGEGLFPPGPIISSKKTLMMAPVEEGVVAETEAEANKEVITDDILMGCLSRMDCGGNRCDGYACLVVRKVTGLCWIYNECEIVWTM